MDAKHTPGDGNFQKVLDLMLDGNWRTPDLIGEEADDTTSPATATDLVNSTELRLRGVDDFFPSPEPCSVIEDVKREMKDEAEQPLTQPPT